VLETRSLGATGNGGVDLVSRVEVGCCRKSAQGGPSSKLRIE